MHKITTRKSKMSMAILCFVVLLISVGCTPTAKTTKPEKFQPSRAELMDRIKDLELFQKNLTLSIIQSAPLDKNTLLAGGYYTNGAGSIRSVLLRSTDGGQTWQDTDVWLPSFRTSIIYVLDSMHAFVAMNYSVEGSLAPYVIFRTEDAGATWYRSEQDLPFDNSNLGIPSDVTLFFASPEIGYFQIAGSFGKKHYYTTTDAGRTWKLSHVCDYIDGEQYFDYKIEKDSKNKQYKTMIGIPVYNDWETVGTMPSEYYIDGNANISPAESIR